MIALLKMFGQNNVDFFTQKHFCNSLIVNY